jgi:hypothetical protein
LVLGIDQIFTAFYSNSSTSKICQMCQNMIEIIRIDESNGFNELTTVCAMAFSWVSSCCAAGTRVAFALPPPPHEKSISRVPFPASLPASRALPIHGEQKRLRATLISFLPAGILRRPTVARAIALP